MVRFKKIKWKNFLSAGAHWIEVDLDSAPLSLIVGTNGAGKSTLLDAVCFVNFGKPYRKFNKSDVVNTVNKKECRVIETFEAKGNHYEVERGLAPAFFEIRENGEKLQITGEKENQAKLDEILGYNYKSFTLMSILGKANFVPFMDMEAKDRRAFIEDVLDIQVFSQMNKLAKDKVKVYENSITMLDMEIKTLQSKLVALQRAQKEATSNFQEQIDIANAEIERLVPIITQYENDIFEKSAPLAQETSIRLKIKEYTDLKMKISSKLQTLASQTTFLENNDNCSMCKQIISSEFKRETLNHNHPKIEELQNGLEEIKKRIAKQEQKYHELETVKSEVSRIKQQMAAANSSKNTHAANIVNIKKKMSATSAVDEDIKQTNETIDLKSQEKEVQVGVLRLYQKAVLLLKDDAIKGQIIKESLPLINKTVNEHLKSMDFFVNIEFDEQFNEVIKSRYRDTFKYNHFSEGEKMRINLAILFTWRDLAAANARMDNNLLMMDEILDSSLDEAGVDDMMAIIEKIYSDRNIFIISHRGDMMADHFHNILRFEKKDGFSQMVNA